MTERDPSFNLYQFKYWLTKQPDLELPHASEQSVHNIMGDLIGTQVASRLGEQRLQKQIAQHNPNLDNKTVNKLVESFKISGGKVVKLDDLNLVIETSDIKFSLPKMYTKPAT